MEQIEVPIVICNKFISYSVGIKTLCYYCNSIVCLSYSAMKELPMAFLPVCNDCRKEDSNTIFTAPSEFVMRSLYENK